MDPLISLVRRWAVDWLASRDPSVCDEILAPSYALSIGGLVLEGRDAYVAATLGQLERFDGLGITVHELICSGDRVALRFTEHGADSRREGRRAAWGGVALFGWDGRRLTHGCAEEDYLARRRQLASGECDPIEPPAPAPWNTAVEAPDPDAEAAVHRWLDHGDLSPAGLDDDWLGHNAAVRLEGATVDVDELFSAGSQVAFHAVARGRRDGVRAAGSDGVRAAGRDGVRAGRAATDGRAPAALPMAGIVTVEAGEVAGGRVVRDRLGLQRALA